MKKTYFFLLFLPFLSFWIGYLLIQYLHAPAVLLTPSLIGCTLPEAARLCQPHLALRVIQTVNDAQLQDGTVLRQIPAPGQKIKTHQIISLVISAQPPQDQAPDYVGKSLQDCTAHAQQHNYTLQIYPIRSTSPKNSCIAQIPAPGKLLTNGKNIIVYVSAPESDWWIIPNYCHHPVVHIQEYASTDALTLQIIHTSSVPPQHACNNHCVVIDQRPLPGSVIKNGTKQTMTLYVHTFDT